MFCQLYFMLTIVSTFALAARDGDSSLAKHLEPKLGDTRVADQLFNAVRVVCLIMTHLDQRDSLLHVKHTWGKRCTVLLFITTEDTGLPTVPPVLKASQYNQWAEVVTALRYVYLHHQHNADWILLAHDDTYVIMENLRFFLLKYRSSDPLYLGCLFRYGDQAYMYGGSGYVLSRNALELLLSNESCLRNFTGSRLKEDVIMGLCLNTVSVRAIDTRDKEGRGRFFPDTPETHLFPSNRNQWYWDLSFHPLLSEV